jgi:hypothetical protein
VWPKPHYEPVIGLTYAQETQNGYEYAGGISMLQAGLEKEGMDVIGGIRGRYNGENRNPFNEFEAGSNYARSMASYAILLTYSGFIFDMPKEEIGFAPMHDGKYFWCLDKAWGMFERVETLNVLQVLYGAQKVRRFRMPNMVVNIVTLDGQPVKFRKDGWTVIFDETLTIGEGKSLVFE